MNKASKKAVGADFTEVYEKLEMEMNRVKAKLEAVECEKGNRGHKEWQCWLFLRTISNFGNDDGAGVGDMPGERFFYKEVFLSLVDKVVVGEGLRFVLRDGTEWEARGR